MNIKGSRKNKTFLFLGINTLLHSTKALIHANIKAGILGSGINFYQQVPFPEQEEYCKVFPAEAQSPPFSTLPKQCLSAFQEQQLILKPIVMGFRNEVPHLLGPG